MDLSRIRSEAGEKLSRAYLAYLSAPARQCEVARREYDAARREYHDREADRRGYPMGGEGGELTWRFRFA